MRGEVCVRGPTIFQGYHNNPSATAEAFDEDGYFKTGDIGYCDKVTKRWYIVDRKKELIKVRGFQVAPAEIEAVLNDHPRVMEVAVIGVSIPPDNAELPRAYVVLNSGPVELVTEEEIVAFASERLSRYKRLEGGVRFIKTMPKNPTGKILKRVLREYAQAEIKQKRGSL